MLLAVCARQLQKRKEDLEKVAAAVKASRERNKKWFDQNKKLRKDKLVVRDWVPGT